MGEGIIVEVIVIVAMPIVAMPSTMTTIPGNVTGAAMPTPASKVGVAHVAATPTAASKVSAAHVASTKVASTAKMTSSTEMTTTAVAGIRHVVVRTRRWRSHSPSKFRRWWRCRRR
jgi:hypothetical protein